VGELPHPESPTSDTSDLRLLAIGDGISLDGAKFRQLFDASFAEIEKRFT